MTDSAHIIRYIDEAFEGPSLVPEDAHERELTEQWIEQQDLLKMRELSYASFKGMLGLVLRKVTMPLRLSKLRRLSDGNPDLAGLYEAKIEDVLQWRATTANTGEIAEIRSQIEAVLRRVDEQLRETRHLAADTYSLADVAWTCVLARLKMMGLAEALWGNGRSPRVEAYYEHLRQRPSFVRADIWEAPPAAKVRRALLKSALTGSRTAEKSI